MYIFKNAMRCISRSKGRNFLIGIIVFVIAVSACIGLSVRKAAEDARSDTMAGLTITATISFDRSSAMQNMAPPEQGSGKGDTPPSFDRDEFKNMMGKNSDLTLDEYKKYAEADSVKSFYYTSEVGVNGDDELEPVTTESETETQTQSDKNSQNGNFPGGGMGMPEGFGNFKRGSQSDFLIVGVSGAEAMTDIINGTTTIEGDVFDPASTEKECLISTELATYNSLSKGNKITLVNPNAEDETLEITVVGIFTDSSANQNSFSPMGMTSTDPANKIYMGYAALEAFLNESEKNSETLTDEDTGREYETALSQQVKATYVFGSEEDYNAFESQVRAMGLDESYQIQSSDLNRFNESLVPLETLSNTAGYFLLVILIIGAIILVVLNIFSVRERKYEIGVLTAMGMKKFKVAGQFLVEIFAVTLIAVMIGAGVGAVSSVPVSNALLANQIEAANEKQENITANFGGNQMEGFENFNPGMRPGRDFEERDDTFMGKTAEYVDEITASIDLTVLLQMLGIAVLLTIIAGAFSVLFIMRYEPLKILSNRD